MNLTQTANRVTPIAVDRPGWIPAEIIANWDPDPYAYQTEAEQMPAGGLHGQILAYIMEVLRAVLQKRDLMLLLDVFMLYRDTAGIKQRIAPDLLLMPYRYPPPSAYDLDVQPAPLCVVEVTSPDSHLKDLEENVPFYLGLGVPTYLVIDAVTPRKTLREPIGLYVWRMVGGQPRKILPDAEGSLLLPEMGLKILVRGQRISFVDAASGQPLFDVADLMMALDQTRQALTERDRALDQTRQALTERDQELEREREARRQAEAELERLRAILRNQGQQDEVSD